MTKVFVGMSGGVDSSLSAALLVEQGYDVTGVYMKNWTADLPGMKCPWAEDLADAKRVAVQLGIPFKVFDFQKEYKSLVVDYMIREYQAGRTPNPDIMCNQEVKFGLFLQAALNDGADMIATGHYAKVLRKTDLSSECVLSRGNEFLQGPGLSPVTRSAPKNFRPADETFLGAAPPRATQTSSSGPSVFLARAKDTNKDQTYFLYRITSEALQKTLFPIGDLTKTEVRKEATKRGLVTARKKDSQGICFVGSVGIRDFLSQFIESKPGNIIDEKTGKTIGQHDGAIFYTFGQRHGMGLGGGLPYYVVGKNMTKNEVYVSSDLNTHEFWRHEIELVDVHWINPSTARTELIGKKYQIRVRHQAPLVDATLARTELMKKSGLVIKLVEPERAIAPGQSIVIYDGDVVLGGGIVK